MITAPLAHSRLRVTLILAITLLLTFLILALDRHLPVFGQTPREDYTAYYVRGEILMAGEPSELDLVVDALPNLGVRLQRQEFPVIPPRGPSARAEAAQTEATYQCHSTDTQLYFPHLARAWDGKTLAQSNTAPTAARAKPLAPTQVNRIREFRKYIVAGASGQFEPTVNAIIAINIIRRRFPDQTRSVTATPNMRTVGSGQWDIGDSPIGVPPVPLSGTGPTVVAAFNTQWALSTPTAAGSPRGVELPTRHRRTGEGIIIGVFDTSTGPSPVVAHPVLSQTTIVSRWAAPPISPPAGPPPASTPAHINAPDHGLYVSGLAKVVAPNAEVHLWRVLDDYGRGDLATLLSALISFDNTTGVPGQPAGNRVINLSLGMHPLPVLDEFLNDEDIALFHETVRDMTRCGYVFVASAGNAASRQQGVAVPQPQVPALYPEVIGMAGTDVRGDRSIFSQAGRLAAPAGDLRLRLGGPGTPTTYTLDYPANAIIGPLTAARSGYAYWAGTSFSAPLASGLAARILSDPAMCPGPHSANGRCAASHMCDNTGNGPCPVPFDEARPLGGGIINVRRTAP